MTYEIHLTDEAVADLDLFPDDDRLKIIDRIESCLGDNPSLGKHLGGTLSKYQSIRFKDQRIVYLTSVDEKRVDIICIGKREDGSKKDVYKKAEKRKKRKR